MQSSLVTPAEAGLKGLELLQRRIPAAPQGYLRQLLRSGRVLLNDLPLAATAIAEAGDRLVLPDSRRLAGLALQGERLPRVLLETREALIADKPAGLAVHRGVGHETDHLDGRVAALLKSRGERFSSAPVHRLDAGTSGPVLFGKGRRAIAAFGEAFMSGAATKRYLALVSGRLAETGLLNSPVPQRGRARTASSRFRSLAASHRWSLLELILDTGRHHQLRRQLADAGHPVVGDRRYGGPCPAGLDRWFLHCYYLEVPDPFGSGPLVASSPLPQDLSRFWAAIADPEQPTATDLAGLLRVPWP